MMPPSMEETRRQRYLIALRGVPEAGLTMTTEAAKVLRWDGGHEGRGLGKGGEPTAEWRPRGSVGWPYAGTPGDGTGPGETSTVT